jgi:hypothetical protein
MKFRIATCIAILCGVIGCGSGEPIDLGKQTPGRTGSSLSEYAGIWKGYVEAYMFDDGTDAIRLTLDPNGNGALEVGKGEPLPAADPNHDHPSRELQQHNYALITGFAYPIRGATLDADRLRMQTRSEELYRPWCEAMRPQQHTVYVGPSGEHSNTPSFGPPGGRGSSTGGVGGALPPTEVVYTCSAFSFRPISSNGDGTCADSDNPLTPIDCGNWGCDIYCACSDQACTLRDDESNNPPVRIDAALTGDGDHIEGTLVLSDARVRIRMTRQ